MKTKHCPSCKLCKPLSDFHKTHARYDGLNGYCKVCTSRKSKHVYQNNKEVVNKRSVRWHQLNKKEYIKIRVKYNATPKGKFATYKDSAKQKELKFSIDFNQFMQLWQKPCHYCGDPILTVGIDRVDNSVGYAVSNIVPCCTKCNYFKKALTQQEFIKHCCKVADRLGHTL